MALRGNFSQSFLRSKDLLSYSEISHDREGNNILGNKILKEALARDAYGQLIRNKLNIAKILNKYGVLYRMVFNAMNMDQYTYNEVQEALEHLSEYINDLGVSGIVEFHAADKTQNSDHIHFWISSEDTIIYNKIAQEMVAMGYSNKEDIYIQKYEDNKKLDEIEYVHNEDTPLRERFSIKPMEMEENFYKSESTSEVLSYLREKYNSILDKISNLFKVDVSMVQEIEKPNDLDSFKKKPSITEECTLPKTNVTNSILSRIEELREK